MSKLQNNFTTVEQSKRLLELGMPANSADCYYVSFEDSEDCEISIRTKGDTGNAFFKVVSYIPCWSVGRLIEIYHICVGPGCSFTFHVCFPNLMNEIIYKLGEAHRNGWLDLKKLEE